LVSGTEVVSKGRSRPSVDAIRFHAAFVGVSLLGRADVPHPPIRHAFGFRFGFEKLSFGLGCSLFDAI